MPVHFTPSANKPRPFPVVGASPGARCGHTLTAIAGHDGDNAGAKLVMFGRCISPPKDALSALCRTRPVFTLHHQVVPPRSRVLAGETTPLHPPTCLVRGCVVHHLRSCTSVHAQASDWPAPPAMCTSWTCALAAGTRSRHWGSPPPPARHTLLQRLATWWSSRAALALQGLHTKISTYSTLPMSTAPVGTGGVVSAVCVSHPSTVECAQGGGEWSRP